MRKIVTWLYVSLDGVIEAPEKWAPPFLNDEVGQVVASGQAAADTLLLGRRTYQEFAAYWPHQTSDVPFADVLNNTPKLVASRTLKAVDWQNTTLIQGDARDELAEWKRQPGKDMVVLGSATLVRSLLLAGLLDELGILLFPIVLGSGKRLFENGTDQVALKLIDSKTFGTGVVSLTYQPAVQQGAEL